MATSNTGEADRVESGTEARTDRTPTSTAVQYARRTARSGVLAGVVGGASLLQGLRAIRRGDRRRGLGRVLLGASFVAVAAVQRRSTGETKGGGGTDADRADVPEPSPDVGGGESGIDDERGAETGAGSGRRAGGDAATGDDDHPTGAGGTDTVEVGESGTGSEAEGPGGGVNVDAAVTDTPRGVEGADETGVDTGTDVEDRTYERLGEAAFDEHGREVPVPQRAFDQRVLSLGDEAFWGIRESDDAVIVTGLFDSLQEQEGVRYVASSRIDEERTLQVPDVVTNHWNEVGGGGIAVAGGDDLVFALAEDTEAGDQLLVVPEQWADDFPGLGGGEGEGEREERGAE